MWQVDTADRENPPLRGNDIMYPEMDSINVLIIPMSAADWPDVAAIYQEGIDGGQATFEAAPPATWDDWCAGKINSCSLVAKRAGQVLGWAALSPVSRRHAYAGVAEVSVYVGVSARRQGVGSLLLAALIQRSEAGGIWTLQAGIFPENQASINLHIKHGFRLVGRREKLGLMEYGPHQGQWRPLHPGGPRPVGNGLFSRYPRGRIAGGVSGGNTCSPRPIFSSSRSFASIGGAMVFLGAMTLAPLFR